MCIIYYLYNRVDQPVQLLSYIGNQMSGPGQGRCRSCGCLHSLRYYHKKNAKLTWFTKAIQECLKITLPLYWAIVRSLFSSAQLCLTLCNPMDCSMPGLPVHCQLPEFTQTHVHWVGDAIQSSHPLSSPSPPALNISQHQGNQVFSNE